MWKAIAGIFERRQRRRVVEPPVAAQPAPAPENRTPGVHGLTLRGEDSDLVRPYVLTPEERQERRRQRQRRRQLWLAAYGIDAGPRWIHGVEVTAR